MADQKISALTALTTPDVADVLPIVDHVGPETKKITWANILAALDAIYEAALGFTPVPDSRTVNGHALTSNVTVSKSDVSLGNVDNTSNATERAATATLSNKRMARRVGTVTQSATPTINSDNVDEVEITALAQAITSFTTNLTGTPVAGDILIINITDNGTARALTFGSSFEASTIALPTTTVISTKITIAFKWNTVTSKWRCVGSA